MNNLRLQLPELVVPGKRLGRHIGHDERSAAFLVREAAAQTARWQRVIPVLDQGNTGSCTGNATTGCLGTETNYDALSAAQRNVLDETFARDKVYSLATKLDSYPGQYPPTDTGSDGLSAAKAAQQLGFTNGYTHATSLAGCWSMIVNGPFMIGVNWYAGFDNPDSSGLVKISGPVRGGHEFEIIGYDAGTGLWEAVNSWGDSWGKAGHFFFSDATMTRLLAEQGDATQVNPLSVAPPTPKPVNSTTRTFTVADAATLDAWAAYPRKGYTGAAGAWKRGVSA